MFGQLNQLICKNVLSNYINVLSVRLSILQFYKCTSVTVNAVNVPVVSEISKVKSNDGSAAERASRSRN